MLVQRGRSYGYDNSYILSAAAAAPDRLRAVCAVDGRAADCAARADALLDQPGACAIRFMEPERDCGFDWLDGLHARAAWQVAAGRKAMVQVHFFPWARDEGIPRLLRLIAEIPLEKVIVDNLSNIDLAAPHALADPLFRECAALPQVHMRVTTMALDKCRKARIDPAAVVQELAQIVPPGRLLWGTDILPPCLDYAAALQLGIEACARLDPAAQQAVLHDNANNLFFGVDG